MLKLCIIGYSDYALQVKAAARKAGYGSVHFADTRMAWEINDPTFFEDCPEEHARLAADGWLFAIGTDDPGERMAIKERMPGYHFAEFDALGSA